MTDRDTTTGTGAGTAVAPRRPGLQVGRVCLGTMYFGTTIDEEQAFRLLDRLTEAGGRFLDTADCYSFWAGGNGDESELVLGRWLAHRGGSDGLVVATKVGMRPAHEGAPWPEQAEGLAPEVIRSAFRASLGRLGLERVDVLYTHADVRSTPLEVVLATLDELRTGGLVGELGCSNITAWRIAEARAAAERLGIEGYRWVQLRHTYLHPHDDTDLGNQVAIGADHRDLVATHPELRLVGYSSSLQGAYSHRADRPLPRGYDTPDNRERLRRLRQVAAEVGATENQVVLARILAGDPAVVPVIAASTTDQLRENLDALDLTLTPAQLATLDAPTLD